MHSKAATFRTDKAPRLLIHQLSWLTGDTPHEWVPRSRTGGIRRFSSLSLRKYRLAAYGAAYVRRMIPKAVNKGA